MHHLHVGTADTRSQRRIMRLCKIHFRKNMKIEIII